MKLSLAGMKGLGASCWGAKGASSASWDVVAESVPAKGTTEGAAAATTGVLVVVEF